MLGDLPAAPQDQPPEQLPTLTAQGITITIDEANNSLRWGSIEGTRTLGADFIQLGLVSAYDERPSYNPYGLKVDTSGLKPPLERWVQLTQLKLISIDAERAALNLTFEEDVRASLEISVQRERIAFKLTPQASTGSFGAIAYYKLSPKVDAEERFYGLGEYFDRVEHRGTIRAMQLEVQSNIESGYNEAHVPIPLLISTASWGMFVASDWPGVFDVAKNDPERVEAIFGAGPLADQGINFHLLSAPHPLGITKGYYEITGYPKLPARWALGPLIWRDENRDQAEVLSDAQAVRDLDLATTGLWIDRPYASGVNSFDFAPSMFPDPALMITTLHDQGLRVGLWHTPYVDKSDPATAQLFAEAKTNGYFPPMVGPALNRWSDIIDLTNAAARTWWKGLIGRYVSMGIEGFKLDYGEDIVPGLLGRRLPWSFADGSDERTMHARFQERYHSAYAEALEGNTQEQGNFLLCRAGTWGDQVHGCIIWPGDLDANMLYHGEQGQTKSGESYYGVGGLPAALIAGLSLGPSGYPFYGSDTGGYRHSPVDKETFARWFEQTALSTVMQIGTSANDVAWEFKPENGFDEELLGWYRIYTRLHLRLFPYIWSYAVRLAEDGYAIQRPLGLAYPELKAHPNDIYMLGDNLLVAPVVRPGERTKDVLLPPGAWFDWWSGQRYDGGQTITVDAPLGKLPLFLRDSGIVPMLRPTIDTMSPVADAAVIDSYATSPGRLWITMACDNTCNTSFDLFDGGTIQTRINEQTALISLSAGQELKHGYQLELMGFTQEPSEITADDQPLPKLEALDDPAEEGWSWEPNSATPLKLRVKATTRTLKITRP